MARRGKGKRRAAFKAFLKKAAMAAAQKKFSFASLTDPEETFPLKDVHSQLQSPLFGVLPPEIRKMIFTFVLTDYERTTMSDDGKKLYFHHRIHNHTRRTDTELLRTCKRVFQETWLMPFALAKHGLADSFFVFGWPEPQINIAPDHIDIYLGRVKRFAKSQRLEQYLPRIDGFQVFFGSGELSEAWHHNLYPKPIDDMIDLQQYRPKNITITIDYTKDSPKFIEAKWVNTVRFSPAVKIIEMEFRALMINKHMLGLIAEFVAKNWFFRREDGMVFKPITLERSLRYLAGSDDPKREDWYWEELVGGPGKYYRLLINTVTWKATPGFDPFTDGYECPNLDFEDYVFPADFEDHPFGIQVL